MGKILLFLSPLILFGCVSAPKLTQIKSTDIKPITYDYKIHNTSKDTLFSRARNHFATIYGDSRSVIRVEDKKEGMILGKAAVDWKLKTGSSLIPHIQCTLNYNVRFMAKENKARLQLELIEGIPSYSECKWELPTTDGYQEILASFKSISIGVEKSLHGSGSVESFKNF